LPPPQKKEQYVFNYYFFFLGCLQENGFSCPEYLGSNDSHCRRLRSQSWHGASEDVPESFGR
ncbi:hypothetical protein, partial [Devosia indica]